MSDSKWERRADVETVVEHCVQRWHGHLSTANIVALARPKPGKKAGREVWATIKIASPKEQILYSDDGEGIDYVLVVAKSVWSRLPNETRIALVDHELCHASGFDFESEKWTIRGHDIEEFGKVIERHGPWTETVRAFMETAQRIPLPQMTLDELAKA
jgi:predicted metallopeptidase